MSSQSKRFALTLFLMFMVSNAWPQNLEPRRWTHLPVNSNFIGLGAGNSKGDIYLDHALQIEDGSMDLYFLNAGYIHVFALFGKTARLDVNLPYARGRWEGQRFDLPVSTRRTGFSDPSVRLSWNLLGSPPLQGKEFVSYRAANPVRTIVGIAVELTVPWGEYSPDLLINLGNNRYMLRPQIGVLHSHDRWEFETTASVYIFGRNDDMFGGVVRDQDPLWFLQGHVSYTFTRGIWTDIGAGYGYGGENTIDGIRKHDDGRVSFWAVSLGTPLGPKQSLKLTFARSQTNTRTGSDLDSLIASWSRMF